jgi:hypothetical protein
VPFYAVPSVPCFELWVLIHFVEINAFADRHEIIARLKTHIAGYEKGRKGVFALTEPNLAVATERAGWLRQQFDPHNDQDPYTSVDLVVVVPKDRLKSISTEQSKPGCINVILDDDKSRILSCLLYGSADEVVKAVRFCVEIS